MASETSERDTEKTSSEESKSCLSKTCEDQKEAQEGDTNGMEVENIPKLPDSEVSGTMNIMETKSENVPFVVIFGKKKYDLSMSLDAVVSSLKQEIQKLTGVPAAMQKLIFKGAPKIVESKTLRDMGMCKGGKVMVVGSTLEDVLKLDTSPHEEVAEEKTQTTKEPLCKQKMHQKIIGKGVPEDVMPGIRNAKDALPTYPLSGMVNKSGGKVRLTFKLELDQLWLGTKERTEKMNMSSIKNVINEPIEGHEEYHIMALQLGPTEASRYWIYWVPAQYVDAIKDTILGK